MKHILSRKPTPAEINDVANEIVAKTGQHPNTVRKALAARGLHWQVPYLRHDGFRARQRRLRAAGQDICLTCGGPRRKGVSPCDRCLAMKWSTLDPILDPTPTIHPFSSLS